jgi:hypothetical protein
MKELKFRGFSSSIGWVYGYAWHGLNDWWYIKHTVETKPTIFKKKRASHLEDVPVETESVAMFSGEVDKNGVEIYDGSICERNGHKRVIVYHKSAFYCLPTKKGETDIDHIKAIRNGWFLANFLTDIEVVGSVFENPDLIGKYAKKV